MARKRPGKFRLNLEKWAARPLTELSRPQRILRWYFDLAKHCSDELRHDRAGQMAAALTYHTLFSLLPTIVLMLVAIKPFVEEPQRAKIKNMAVEWFTAPLAAEVEQEEQAQQHPPDLVTPDHSEPAPDIDAPGPAPDATVDPNAPPGGEKADAEDTAAAEAARQAREKREAFEAARRSIESQVQGILDSLENVSFAGLGAIGLLVFIYGATGLLTTIEKSFNIVYDAPRMRQAYLRFPLYFTMIVLGPMVILAGQAAQEYIKKSIEAGDSTGWLAGPLVFLTPILTVGGVATLIFKWMPNTRVQWRSAAVGGFVTSFLWFGAIEGLKVFVRNSATSSVYGAMFLLPLFLMFLWVSWLIVLFGLEVSYTLQHIKRLRFKHNVNEQVVIDSAWLLPLITEIAEQFEAGRTITIDRLSHELNLPARAVSRMLNALETAELVRRIDADSETAAFTLARPADRISAASVLAVGDMLMPDIATGAGDDAAWKLIRKLRSQWQNTAEDTTLAQLARDNRS